MQAIAIRTAGTAGNGGGTAPEPRLVRAAHEFEAMMMKELLKPMTGSDEDDADASGGVLGDFAAEALGQGLSAGGGFGIADDVIRSLSHSGTAPDSGKVTGNGHRNTEIKGHE